MNNKGFTLVELIAVLAILSIIVLMAIPTVSNSLNKEDKLDIKRRQSIIVSEVELKIDDISRAITLNGCCKVSSLKALGIITESQSKDKNGVALTGGVKYNEKHEVVYDESCNRTC